jgi:MoxR-like ATPase
MQEGAGLNSRDPLVPVGWAPNSGDRRSFVRYSRRLSRRGAVVTGYDVLRAETDEERALVAVWRDLGIHGPYVVWDHEDGSLAGFDAWDPAYAYSLTLDGRSWDELPRSVTESIADWNHEYDTADLAFNPLQHSAGFPAPVHREGGSSGAADGTESSEDFAEGPEGSRRALCVFVGERSQANLAVGLQAETWGFRELRPELRDLAVGDFVLLTSGFSGGSPRVQAAEWTTGRLERVELARISQSLYEGDELLWPDEIAAGQVIYPHRIRFTVLNRVSQIPLDPEAGSIGGEVSEALRLSAINRGLGYVAPAAGSLFRHPDNHAQLSGWLRRVMELQSHWVSTNTDEMRDRGLLVRQTIPGFLRENLPNGDAFGIDDLDFEGRDGTGRKTRVPWTRAHSRNLSPSATEGWYVVYLFSFDGKSVYLSLNQGTTTFEGGEYRPKDAATIAARVAWARDLLADELADDPRLLHTIDLADPQGDLAAGYEAGNVTAIEYRLEDIPDDEYLLADLQGMLRMLGTVYAAGVPGAEPQHWLFQGNPKRWAGMLAWLAEANTEVEDSWTANNYAKEIQPGDLVAFWKSGSDGGICAIGTITGGAFDRPNRGVSDAQGEFEPAVHFRATQFLDPLISREECKNDPVLQDLPVLHFANATNFRLTPEQWEAIMSVISIDRRPEPQRRPLDPERLRTLAEAQGLLLDDEVYFSLVAALSSDKHVMLTGAPGTAKTTLAALAAQEAADAGWCSGYSLTTATADWTTYETIGGLRPTADGQLEFAAGHFLDAIRSNKWLVIDELNRSNFDRAFGQLFTVLAGQWVVLPYADPTSGRPVAIAPAAHADDLDPGAFALTRIPESWRIIATMNVFDKSLLFEMSFALMRRFAFIEVKSPSDDAYRQLIAGRAAEERRADVLDAVSPLLALRPVKELGPALFIDMARYADARLALGGATAEELRFQLFYSYLLPQFEGISDQEGRDLYAKVRPLVAPDQRRELRDTIETVLGVQLPTRATRSNDDDIDDEDDQDD